MVDSSEGVENRYGHNVQAEVALVRFALSPLLVRVVLRHRYSSFVLFHRSITGDVQVRRSLQIYTIAIVPMFLLDLSSRSYIHPSRPRQSENRSVLASSHDRAVYPSELLLITSEFFVLMRSPCEVDCVVVILGSNFVAAVGAADGSYLAVGLSVVVSFFDVVFV